jgi:hypothetical protein
MIPSELKDLLHEYDEGRIKASQQADELHNFGVWWWRKYLTESQRERIKVHSEKLGWSSVWEDLRRHTDEELMFLWAVFKM